MRLYSIFDPCLRCLVEEVQREFRDAFEHLHQPPLERRPEHSLLAVLIGTVGQGPLVDDPQPQEPFGHLVGDHRPAVVAHQRPEQAAFLDALREPVRQVLGGFRQIPLQVAAEPRAVVEDAQGQRLLPLAAGREHRERAVVEVEVPQCADVFRLVAADLPLFPPPGRADLAGSALGCPRLADHAVGLHVPPDGGVRTWRPQRRVGLGRRAQVVVVQLVGPVLVRFVLRKQAFGQPRRQRDLATVLAQGPLQHAHRVVLLRRAL